MTTTINNTEETNNYEHTGQMGLPLPLDQIITLAICVALGALLGILPYLLEYRAVIKYGALLRSLGDPPVGNGTAAGHYFNAVVERAAAVALALAVSGDLLSDDD